MVNDKEEDNIKKMATLLREGATMLNLSCPVCTNLLFKLKDNTIFCPSCNKKVIVQKQVKIEKDTVEKKNIEEKLYSKNNFNKELANLKIGLNSISYVIATTKEITILKEAVQILEKLINSYKALNVLNNE